MSSEEAVTATLRRLERERLTMLAQLEDVVQDSSEHRLVLKNLAKLPEDRRCYRIVGGVAVQRTVEEVKPELSTHADRLDQFKVKINEQLETLNAEIAKVKASLQAPAEAT